jgi:hypothetical protein
MTSPFPVESLAAQLVAAGVPRDRALARARLELGVPDSCSEAAALADESRDEKAIVAQADRQMRALGFVVVNFSQPRASKQTPGIPDREYFHPARGLFLKWEAKAPTGRQSPAQAQYQTWCEAAGIPYVLGTDDALYQWLVDHGHAARTVGEMLIGLPYAQREGA